MHTCVFMCRRGWSSGFSDEYRMMGEWRLTFMPGAVREWGGEECVSMGPVHVQELACSRLCVCVCVCGGG